MAHYFLTIFIISVAIFTVSYIGIYLTDIFFDRHSKRKIDFIFPQWAISLKYKSLSISIEKATYKPFAPSSIIQLIWIIIKLKSISFINTISSADNIPEYPSGLINEFLARYKSLNDKSLSRRHETLFANTKAKIMINDRGLYKELFFDSTTLPPKNKHLVRKKESDSLIELLENKFSH